MRSFTMLMVIMLEAFPRTCDNRKENSPTLPRDIGLLDYNWHVTVTWIGSRILDAEDLRARKLPR